MATGCADIICITITLGRGRTTASPRPSGITCFVPTPSGIVRVPERKLFEVPWLVGDDGQVKPEYACHYVNARPQRRTITVMLKKKHYIGLDSWEMRAMAELESEMVAYSNAQAESGIINHELIQKLFALDRAQSKELSELRGTVKVLTEMLVQSGAIDEEIFGYRMEAEMDRLRSQDEATRADASRIECAQCKTRVPKASTHLDAYGAVCDACHFASGT